MSVLGTSKIIKLSGKKSLGNKNVPNYLLSFFINISLVTFKFPVCFDF